MWRGRRSSWRSSRCCWWLACPSCPPPQTCGNCHTFFSTLNHFLLLWFVIVTWLSILCGLVRQDFRHSLTLEFLFRSLLVTLRFLLWRNITESYKHVTIGSYVQLKTINEGDGNYLGFFNQLGFEMYLTTWRTQNDNHINRKWYKCVQGIHNEVPDIPIGCFSHSHSHSSSAD